jgi:hypothetical protein
MEDRSTIKGEAYPRPSVLALQMTSSDDAETPVSSSLLNIQHMRECDGEERRGYC